MRWIIPELIKYGKIKRPTLGIEIASNGILQRLGRSAGVLIVKVIPDGPAAQAGLQPTLRNGRGNIILGDIIRAINDEVVNNSNQLSIAIEKYKTGDEIKLTLERQEELVEVMLILGQAK